MVLRYYAHTVNHIGRQSHHSQQRNWLRALAPEISRLRNTSFWLFHHPFHLELLFCITHLFYFFFADVWSTLCRDSLVSPHIFKHIILLQRYLESSVPNVPVAESNIWRCTQVRLDIFLSFALSTKQSSTCSTFCGWLTRPGRPIGSTRTRVSDMPIYDASMVQRHRRTACMVWKRMEFQLKAFLGTLIKKHLNFQRQLAAVCAEHVCAIPFNTPNPIS